MATLTVTDITLAGVAQTLTSADSGGDEFANTGREVFIIDNGDASQMTVTISAQKNCNCGETHDLAVAVDAGEARAIGPFSPEYYNDSDGLVQVTYSSVTSLTVNPFKLP